MKVSFFVFLLIVAFTNDLATELSHFQFEHFSLSDLIMIILGSLARAGWLLVPVFLSIDW